MFVKVARVFFFCLCFVGFLLQGWELFFKFSEGATTTITSKISPKSGLLNFPRLSICLDPPTTLSRLSKLGLSLHSWNSNQLDPNEFVETNSWPITSENDTDLFDRSMFSFEEVFENITYFNRTLHVEDTQYYKEINTRHTGKCFSVLLDKYPGTANSPVFIKLKNVFKGQDGHFRIFLHEPGMELLLVNQFWFSTKKFVLDISPGTFTDIMIRKHVYKKLYKPQEFEMSCRSDWSDIDYYQCCDEYLDGIREPYHCTSIFDVSLNQSALALKKPICTSFNDTKTLVMVQENAWFDNKLDIKCPPNCNRAYYTASTTDVKMIGSQETTVYLTLETLDTLIEEEVLVYDGISMISAVGGSLGLFLGFSFLDIAFKLVQIFQDHLKAS